MERALNGILAGQNGTTLTETDAKGALVSQSIKVEPVPGARVQLSLDAEVTQGLYDAIATVADQSGFQGGSGVIMDVQTGELLAMTSYPEYSMDALSRGDQASLTALNADKRQPFLNRAVSGLYAPGSIVKPFMGVAALEEGVIDEHKQILSTGSISIPNPYNPDLPSVFKDWRVNGLTDVRRAIAVSSDVYFYEVGGGYKDQPGLGIDRIDKYLRIFGFGAPTGIQGFKEPAGNIPTPAWKEATFDGDPWRIGDTYHTGHRPVRDAGDAAPGRAGRWRRSPMTARCLPRRCLWALRRRKHRLACRSIRFKSRAKACAWACRRALPPR